MERCFLGWFCNFLKLNASEVVFTALVNFVAKLNLCLMKTNFRLFVTQKLARFIALQSVKKNYFLFDRKKSFQASFFPENSARQESAIFFIEHKLY